MKEMITHYLRGTSPSGEDILIAFTTLGDSTEVFVQPYHYTQHEYRNASMSWCEDVLGTSLRMNNSMSKGLARDFWNALVDNKGFVQGEPTIQKFDYPPTHPDRSKFRATNESEEIYSPFETENKELYQQTIDSYFDELARSLPVSHKSDTNYALEA